MGGSEGPWTTERLFADIYLAINYCAQRTLEKHVCPKQGTI